MEKKLEIGGKKLRFVLPSLRVNEEAGLAYSKAYTKALNDGLLPQVVMERLAEKNGSWTTEDIAKVNIITDNIRDCIMELNIKQTQDKYNELRLDFYKLRNDLTEITIKRQLLFSHTAESKGEDAKIAAITWRCVLNEDSTRLWSTEDAFFDEKDVPFATNVLQEYVSFTSGLEGKIEEVEKLFDKRAETKEEEEEIKVENPEEKVIEQATA